MPAKNRVLNIHNSKKTGKFYWNLTYGKKVVATSGSQTYTRKYSITNKVVKRFEEILGKVIDHTTTPAKVTKLA